MCYPMHFAACSNVPQHTSRSMSMRRATQCTSQLVWPCLHLPPHPRTQTTHSSAPLLRPRPVPLCSLALTTNDHRQVHRHVPPQGLPSLVYRRGHGRDGVHRGTRAASALACASRPLPLHAAPGIALTTVVAQARTTCGGCSPSLPAPHTRAFMDSHMCTSTCYSGGVEHERPCV